MLSKENYSEALIFIVLIAFTGYAFSFGLKGIFLLDDHHNIGPAIIESFNISEIIRVISSNTSGALGRPVSVLSFSFTGLAHGGDVWGFKYHNILIHLLLGITIYCTFKRLLSILSKKPELDYQIALFTTAVWLLHPLQVSTVMYAVQRMTQLSALFSVLTILIFLKALQSDNNKRKVTHYFILFPISLLLSILSKESGVLIPVFIAVITFAILYSPTDISLTIKRRLKTNRYDRSFIALFILLPILIGAIGFVVKYDSLTDYSSRPFDIWQRLLSQIDFIFLYINQLILPRLSAMGLFFDDIPIPQGMTFIRATKLVVLSSLLITGVIAIFRGKSILGMGILFYFAGHLLESTIIPLELAFEHRNYLPSIGIFLAISYYIIHLCQRKKQAIIFPVIWATMLLSLLFLRLDYWSDEFKWTQTTLAYHPKSERTQLEYISALARAGQYDLQIQQLDKARKLLPEKLSFQIKKLISNCNNNNHEENKKIIDIIFQHALNKPITTIGFNSLAQLVNRLLDEPCKSASLTNAYIFVGAAMERQANIYPSAPMYGLLNVLKAKLEVHLGNTEKAYSLYIVGFELTGQRKFLFWAVQALLRDSKTREKGLNELENIQLGKYFNHHLEKKRIDKLRQKIEVGDFNFKL